MAGTVCTYCTGGCAAEPLWVLVREALQGDLVAVVLADVCSSVNDVLQPLTPVGLSLHRCGSEDLIGRPPYWSDDLQWLVILDSSHSCSRRVSCRI